MGADRLDRPDGPTKERDKTVTVAGRFTPPQRRHDCSVAQAGEVPGCPSRCSHLPGMTQLCSSSEGARPATAELPSCTKEDADRYQRRAGPAPLGTVPKTAQPG